MTTNSVTDERDIGLFVPSEIDDYGLDPYEFRIYARLVRRAGRGDAWESIPKMARACRMSESRARAALQLLEAAGLIASNERKGDTTIRRLNPKRYWAHPEQVDEIRSNLTRTKTATPSKSDRGIKTATPIKNDTTTPIKSDTTTPIKSDTGVVAEVIPLPLSKVTDEGIPMKAIPLRYSNEGEATAAKTSLQVGESEVEILNPALLEVERKQVVGQEAEPIHDRSFPFSEQHQNACEEMKDPSWGKSSAAVDPEIQRQIQHLAFDWRSRPWMLNATEFQPEMKLAVWRSNPQEYSIAGLDVPNETYICNHLRKLNERLKNPHEAYAAYVKLQTYWKTAQALVNPDIQQQFAAFKVAAKQSSLQSHLAERQQHTLEAIKDLL